MDPFEEAAQVLDRMREIKMTNRHSGNLFSVLWTPQRCFKVFRRSDATKHRYSEEPWRWLGTYDLKQCTEFEIGEDVRSWILENGGQKC